jgi:hypothetical protein
VNDVSATLSELHDQYAEKINVAVSEDRDDIVEALTDEYASVLSTHQRNPRSRTSPRSLARPARRRRHDGPDLLETFGNCLVRAFVNDELVHSALPNAPVRPDPPRRRTLRRSWRG